MPGERLLNRALQRQYRAAREPDCDALTSTAIQHNPRAEAQPALTGLPDYYFRAVA